MSSLTITVTYSAGSLVIQGTGQTIQLSTPSAPQVVQLGSLSAAVNQQITQAVTNSAASATTATTQAGIATTEAGIATAQASAAAASASSAAGSASSAAASATASANAYSAIANGAATDAGTLTGTETAPLSRGAGLLQTTLTKIASFVLSVYTLSLLVATGAVARTLLSVLGDMPVSAKWFGATGNGTTDDTTALQNWINYIVLNNRRGWLPKGNYKVTATLGFSTRPCWQIEGELRGVGQGTGACIVQYTDNIPIFNLGIDTVSLMHAWMIKGISFDYANNQPSTNTGAIPILFSTMAFQGQMRDLYFNRGFYAMQVANGIGCPWGTQFDDIVFGSGLTGGAMDWSLGVNATPNNHFGRFEINCNNMIGPVFIVRGYDFTIDTLEFLSANNSPVLFRLIAGSTVVIGAAKLEIFTYTAGVNLFDIQAGCNFRLGTFSIGGTTGVLNVPSGQSLQIFGMGTSSAGQGAALRVGYVKADATSNANANCYALTVGTGAVAVIDDWYPSSGGWLLQNNASTSTGDRCLVSSFVLGQMSQDLGDVNYTASQATSPNILVFNTAFTAARTITLPSNGNQFFNGLWFEIVLYGAVNGSNTATIVSGATTLRTQTTDKVVMRFTWRRNASGALGWVMTKYETLP